MDSIVSPRSDVTDPEMPDLIPVDPTMSRARPTSRGGSHFPLGSLVRGCFDNDAGGGVLASLPIDFLRSHILECADCISLCRLSETSRVMCLAASDDELWSQLYQSLWPSWLVLEEDPTSATKSTLFRDKVAMRCRGQLPLRVAQGIRRLEGTCKDDFDGNTTPVTAIVGFQKYNFGAHVVTGTGSLHNTPTQGAWVGKYNDVPVSRNVSFEWQERLSGGRGLWIYSGELCREGRRIHGRFHYKIIPRKTGTFDLCAQPLAECDKDLNLTQLGYRILKQQVGQGRAPFPPMPA